MATYNWQQKDWPRLSFAFDNVVDELFAFSEKAGRVSRVCWKGTFHPEFFCNFIFSSSKQPASKK